MIKNCIQNFNHFDNENKPYQPKFIKVSSDMQNPFETES